MDTQAQEGKTWEVSTPHQLKQIPFPTDFKLENEKVQRTTGHAAFETSSSERIEWQNIQQLTFTMNNSHYVFAIKSTICGCPAAVAKWQWGWTTVSVEEAGCGLGLLNAVSGEHPKAPGARQEMSLAHATCCPSQL